MTQSNTNLQVMPSW